MFRSFAPPRPRVLLVLAGIVAVLVAMIVVLGVSGKAEAKKTSGSLTKEITGTVEGVGTFTGTETINRFAVQNGQLVAIGTVSGTITDTEGNVVQTITNQSFTQQVSVTQASCQILDLTLGPLHLDLLGLVVDLNQVHLTITAEQGSGNLLGNLLCAVAHLLDNTGGGGGGALQPIANLLNQILGILQGL